ncbi:MAG: hypothetical protein PSN34_04255 [Urechidicola sp.]|nr:hypothetical protein [Urechidicola sp.]
MNLWILTEERPKKEVIETIFQKYAKDKNIAVFIDPIRIIPILNKKDFSFVYEITGFKSPKISKVYLKIISGKSSFVDYLVFETKNQPSQKDVPLYAIEETKTDDKESRNTGVYQRCSKFIYVDFFYPKVKKIMLYNLQVEQKDDPTLTYVFGTKMLKTLEVEVLGKKGINNKKFNAFKTIDELIKLKNSMPETKNGVTVRLTKKKNAIEITAKLLNGNRLGHDPNIGMTTIIAKCLRVLGWKKDIIITQHHLPNQQSVGKTNKFIQIANKINIKLKGLKIPKAKIKSVYWYYEENGEKIGTIFLDILVEEFSKGFTIYSNHAGCERSYFLTKKGDKLVVEKYADRVKYKKGDKTQIINLPDLTIVDNFEKLVINIEGEMYKNANVGIKQLNGFTSFEKYYITKHYPKYKIERTVVLYGSNDTKRPIGKISFILNSNGKILISLQAPKVFKTSFNNIIDFWN